MSSYQFSVGPAPTLQVRVAAGRLDIVEGSAGTVWVDVSGPGAENIVVEQLGDTVVVREEKSRLLGRAVDLRVAVPAGIDADLLVASMDLHSGARLGRVVARSASGGLTLAGINSGSLRTASGDVTVDHCDGRLEVATASGDVTANLANGDVIISSASGDVMMERAEGRFQARSASGNIEVGCCRGDEIQVKSMSGDVRIGIPQGTRVEAELETLSGQVRTPERKPPGPSPANDVRLRVKTVSGDIDLRRVEAH
jgi:hypothetical protein